METVNNLLFEQQLNESKARKQAFIREHTMEWLEQGKKLQERRLQHNMSLREVGELLGTAASRIRKIETGEPVSMAEHLATCYNLLFDYIELRNSVFEINEEILKKHSLIK